MKISKSAVVLGAAILCLQTAQPASAIHRFSPESSGSYVLQKKKTLPKPTGEGSIVENPDIPPMFTGGTAQMHKFITGTLDYPDEAAEKNIQGLVVHTFVVEKDGTLSNFVCIHHADSLLDAEALRILKAMPPWRPGKLNGEDVRTKTYVPMYFRLRKGGVRKKPAPAVPVEKALAKTDSAVFQNNDVFTIVDKMPQFPGGEQALAAFLTDKIEYPRQARQDGVEGRIITSFVVDREGNISNIEVANAPNAALGDEAVRVLSLMPPWIPGENNGEKVSVKCMLPIDFKINEAPIPAAPPAQP